MSEFPIYKRFMVFLYDSNNLDTPWESCFGSYDTIEECKEIDRNFYEVFDIFDRIEGRIILRIQT